MSVSLSAAALILGWVVDRLGRRSVPAQTILGTVAVLFIATQIALITRVPIPPAVIWAIIAGTGAATVVSYSTLAEYYPKEISGLANSALNTLHIGGAFVIQTTIGVIVGLWPMEAGHYPAIAYQVALAINLIFQAVALAWFFIAMRLPAHAAISGALLSASAGPARGHAKLS
jgi:MFS family permease